MKKQVRLTASEMLEIARLCSCIRNPTMLLIIEELARRGTASKADFLHIDGISNFTIQQNLQYLRKYGFVNGSLSADKPYSLNFEKLESSKKLLDNFYRGIVSSRPR